ncbi:MAG: MBL fold metallo-hydrolase [Firmicutes bacterium]|nr:MBL fold metallo-hydrolase [Bacillota bacterium]
MIVERMEVGELGVNCYVVACEPTRQAIVIDPGAEAERIARLIETRGYSLSLIVNTHGHFDHIGGNAHLKGRFSPTLAIHRSDAGMLADAEANLSCFLPGELAVISPTADLMLSDGDRVTAGTVSLEVIHTPGHTRGSICLLGEGVLFSGDTLFRDGVGRTDLPGGDCAELRDSLATRILVLPDSTRVCPGHGPETSIGQERQGWETRL